MLHTAPTNTNNNNMNQQQPIKEKEKDKDKKLSMYKIEPYKTTLRRDHIARRRELTRQHFLNRERTQAAEGGQKRQGKTISRNVVTIDTHRARGNVEVLRMVIRDIGWREFPFMRRDHNCDVMWHAVSFHDQPDIFSGQVNKFPGALEIFQKVNLFRWLEFMKTLFPEQYDFFPRTWLLPQQFSEFAAEVRSMNEKKQKHKPVFIVKPSEGSQGDGIYLLKDPQQYTCNTGKHHVIQEYLSSVLLLEKFKFDLRIYVVLKSLDPLEFHVCKEGLARFSTVPYEQPNNRNLGETYMHLTNYSLNKKSSTFKISAKEDEGSKRKMTAVFAQLSRLGYDMELCWTRIEKIIVKTLIAVAGELKVELQAAAPSGKPGPTCFQILGFDVLIMKNMEPKLLEVNSNPSLSITEEHELQNGSIEYLISAKDEDVKRTLIRDALILIAPKNKYTRKRLKRRRHRHVRGRNAQDGEEPMDVDGEGGRMGERDVSVRFMDVDDDKTTEKGRVRSIFDESDYNQARKFVRNETCRVFIEGEGEVLFDEEGPSNPKYFSGYRENENSKKDGTQRKDTNDRLPSVFLKSGDQPAEMMLEDDPDGENESAPTRPLPFDLTLLDSSDEEDEEEESCLKEIFPEPYAEEYEEERIVERLADIFIACLGVKGCLRLGPTMFRLFARKCRLNRKGITNAAIDILYIDQQRRWEYMNPERTSGLGFLGFVSACYEISRRRFYAPSKHEMLKNLVEFCRTNLKTNSLQNYATTNAQTSVSVTPYNTISGVPTASSFSNSGQQSHQQHSYQQQHHHYHHMHYFPSSSLSPPHHHLYSNPGQQRHLGRRDRHKTSLTLFQRSTITSLEGEESHSHFIGGEARSRRQQSFMAEASSGMHHRRNKTNLLPQTLTQNDIYSEDDD